MILKIQAFGQIAEITGRCFEIEASTKLDLIQKLNIQYPQLKDLTYLVAVNKTVISENITLNSQDQVALLPPYSGG